ncbi:hypothetical protein ACFLW3_02525, partial [Chloroflexota bacterium]
EGNRRIATAKQLLKKNSLEKNPNNKLTPKIVKSLESIEVLLLNTDGMSQEDVEHKVSVILGLRHHGSVLEWNPISKAYNILKEYMGLDPVQEDFKYSIKRVNNVASRLSVKHTNVKKGLMTYIVYTQLKNIFPGVKPSHYSLIEAAVTKKALTGANGYFIVNPLSYQMDEPSLAKMDELCQFNERDDPAHGDTIPEPRNFTHLARLVRARDAHQNESVKKHAAGLLLEVESANRTAESAADSLTAFIDQKEWAIALEKALDKQEADLDIESFNPIGMELTRFNEVTNTFERLKRLLQI